LYRVDFVGTPQLKNKGFFVLGPDSINNIISFPGNNSIETIKVKNGTSGPADPNSMTYQSTTILDANTLKALQTTPQFDVFLQRLINPYLLPQPDPTKPLYNPYVTVDYMEGLICNDAALYSQNEMNGHTPTAIADRYSEGRMEPYAAQRRLRRPQV